jgi:hypothetical protein
LFDVQIDGDLADVVQQCGVGDGSGPGFGLRGLILGVGADGQQMRLAQLSHTPFQPPPLVPSISSGLRTRQALLLSHAVTARMMTRS